MTEEPPRPRPRTADADPGGDADTPQPGAVPAPHPLAEPQLPASPVPDPHDPHPPLPLPLITGTDAERWQTALSALGQMLPEDSGRSARSDVERLARNDARRQAQAAADRATTERAERGGDRLSRLRGTTRATRTPQRPQRVRVTSSRMAATARAPLRTVSREIDEQTGVGEVYLRSLLRAQLRLGLSVIAVLALCLGTLPLVFAVVPRLGTVRLLTVPLPWLLVGVSVYPLLFGVAWWHVVAAERAERDFAAIVESD